MNGRCDIPVRLWAAASVCTAAVASAAPGSAADAVAVSAPLPPLPGCSGMLRYCGYLPWCWPPAGRPCRCFQVQMPWRWWGQGHVEELGSCSGPVKERNVISRGSLRGGGIWIILVINIHFKFRTSDPVFLQISRFWDILVCPANTQVCVS